MFILTLFVILLASLTLFFKNDSYISNNAFDKKSGSEEAFKLAQSIENDKVLIKTIGNSVTDDFQAIGRFTNSYANLSGTAVAIGDYTFLTNNHLVENELTEKGRRNYRAAPAKKMKFYPMQSAKSTPYSFSVEDVHMIKGVDLSIVHTKEKIGNKIEPVKIATESNIKDMKFKDKVSIIGYPKVKYFNSRFPELTEIMYPQMFRSDGFYLSKAKTAEPQFYINAITRKGNSGSPIVNKNLELIGIFVNGFNNSGNSSFEYNKEEMGYGVALVDDVREEIIKNNK